MPLTKIAQTELVSIDDYLSGELKSDIKHEYLGGYVYAMAGAKNVHNRITMAALDTMHTQLRGKPFEPVNSDDNMRLEMPKHTRFYYHDAMVICESNTDNDSFQEKPAATIEVISEATRRIDESEKLD